MCHERKATCSESKNNISFENIKELLGCALARFYECDGDLFKYNTTPVSERCMVFRIALYMLEEIKCKEELNLSNFHLDCEYNKHKTCDKTYINSNDVQKKAIPDLLIHRRQFNNDNILVAEFKKGRVEPHNEKQPYNKHIDIEKLIAFTSPCKPNTKNYYGYKFGMYIELHKDKVKSELYEGGEKKESLIWTAKAGFKTLS